MANPLHGDIPYTVQARGCGERGEFIHVTPNFVANVNVTAGALGPPGKKNGRATEGSSAE